VSELESLSLRFDFLDQQLVDADGLPLGRVEDVELEQSGGAAPRVTEVLTGMEALGERIDGGLGAFLARVAGRMRSPAADEGPARIDAKLVKSAGPYVELDVPHDEIPHVAPLERWLAERVVGRIPGAER
jgi:hypothetical protein